MTIAKKLYYGIGGMIALVSLLALLNLGALVRQSSIRSASEKSFEMLREISGLQARIGDAQIQLNNYLLSGDPSEVSQLRGTLAKLDESVRQVELHATDEERGALNSLTWAAHDWDQNFARPLIEKRREVDGGTATVAQLQIFYIQQNPAEWISRIREPVERTMAATEAALREQQSAAARATQFTIFLSIAFSALALAGGIVIASYTARSITRPLLRLIAAAREIGQSGDLDQKIDVDRHDEIGELARTFNGMVAYLREMASVSEAIAGGDLTIEVKPRSGADTLGRAFSQMIVGLRALVRSVRDSASQVASGAGEMASASEESARINLQAAAAIDEVSSTMHEMSVNVQNMVRNTQTQGSSVSETSASIEEMVASIQRVADTARVLLDISQRSREEAHSGIQTMQKAADGLTRINDSIRSSSAIIGNLGEKAHDIGRIVEVIDDLAEQTNLLALNAAIEAARAGEHGLGFAVVADEVRKLAEKSAHSTREIAELIQGIQKEARKAVENMEKSTSIVNDGLNQGTELSNALRKISSVVTEVYKFAQEIGAATNEQSHGSAQIARATTQLNEITHEINSAVEEQASGAHAVVRAMEKMRELVQRSTSGSTELAASAEQMSRMSRTLLDAMDRFALESLASRLATERNGHGHPPAEVAAFAAEGNGRY
jgi:methyl-accepting chemotaxis protein